MWHEMSREWRTSAQGEATGSHWTRSTRSVAGSESDTFHDHCHSLMCLWDLPSPVLALLKEEINVGPKR